MIATVVPSFSPAALKNYNFKDRQYAFRREVEADFMCYFGTLPLYYERHSPIFSFGLQYFEKKN